MDRFEIRLAQADLGTCLRLVVEGTPIRGCLDLYGLQASTKEDGDRWIRTCTCGVDYCAGIKHPVQIFHDLCRVHWSEPENNPPYRFQFDRVEYLAQVGQGLRAMRAMYEAGVQLAPYYSGGFFRGGRQMRNLKAPIYPI